MVSFTSSSKVILLLALLGLLYHTTEAAAGRRRLVDDDDGDCITAYAYEEGKNVCTKNNVTNGILWTNGKYGSDYNAENRTCCCSKPLPQKCMDAGFWQGDPHMTTFDGLKYECQGAGEFDVMDSKYLQIQGRFVWFNPKRRGGTTTKSVVWKHKNSNDPIIQVTVPNTPVGGSCFPWIQLGKNKARIKGPSEIGEQVFITPGIEVKWETKKWYSEGYVFYHHQSKVQATVFGRDSKGAGNGCVLDVKFCIPEDWKKDGGIVGLLGNADGNTKNEWMKRGESEGPSDEKNHIIKYKKGTDWCSEQWKIQDSKDSLFIYEGTDTFDTYNGRRRHRRELKEFDMLDCLEDPDKYVPGLSKVCGTGNHSVPCLVDGCAGDNTGDAKAFLTTERALMDYGCGKEVAHYDFSESDAWKWGEIGYVTGDKKKTEVVLEKDKGGNPFLMLLPGGKKQSQRWGIWLNLFKFLKPVKGGSASIHLFDEFGICNTTEIGCWTQLDLTGGEKEDDVLDGVVWRRQGVTVTTKKHANDKLNKVTVEIPWSYFALWGKLKYKFTMTSDDESDFGGIDNLRIVSRSVGCDVPIHTDVEGDEGSKYHEGCGEAVLDQKFEKEEASAWGVIEDAGGLSVLVLSKSSPLLDILQEDFPTGATALVVEFDMYELDRDSKKDKFKFGFWDICDSDSLPKCNNKALTIRLGNPGSPRKIELKTFEQWSDGLDSDGNEDGIQWKQKEKYPGLAHVELYVPFKHFSSGELMIWLIANIDRDDISIGIDNVRITTHADGCKTGGRRQLQKFMETVERPQPLVSTFLRELKAKDEKEKCSCLSEPRVMKLYTEAHDDCKPKGDPIGTVSMSLNADRKIDFQYDIKLQKIKGYTVKKLGVYVGKEHLPVNDHTKEYLPPDEFPYLDQPSGTTKTVIDDVIVANPEICDFYAVAYAKICKKTSPSSSGDPHVVSWGGERFDFHGGCDLVVLDNPHFHNGVGMTIHIRTKIKTWWSFIESAVVKIGDDTLEIMGGVKGVLPRFWLNGEGKELETGKGSLGEFEVALRRINDHQSQTRVDLGNHGDAISIETYKYFVRVTVKNEKDTNFNGALGLMGSYPNGALVGRDGRTLYADMNAFGQEWQVHESEPKLFHAVEGPQHPTKCLMPEEVSTGEKRRRLGDSMISHEDAEAACAHVHGNDWDACVFDVLATNDLDMAGSY